MTVVDVAAPTHAPSGKASRGPTVVPALDGVRAVAVIMVVTYHACEDRTGWFRGGWAGVDLFFVLSGYLCTRMLRGTELTSHDVIGFLQRRVARLLPALVPLALVGLAVIAFAPSLLGRTVANAQLKSVTVHEYAGTWLRVAAGWENLWAATNAQPVPGLAHLWSLCVEWQFYVCWAVVMAVLSRRSLLLFSGALLLLSALFPLFAYSGPTTRAAIYFATVTHVVAISAGALVAQIDRPRTRWSTTLRLLGWSGLAAIWLVVGETHVKYKFGVLATAVVGATLVYVYSQDDGTFRVLSSRPMRWIGTRSYGIYLWHFPVLCALAPGGYVVRVAGVGMAVILAAASYRWVELPARRWLRNRQNTSRR